MRPGQSPRVRWTVPLGQHTQIIRSCMALSAVSPAEVGAGVSPSSAPSPVDAASMSAPASRSQISFPTQPRRLTCAEHRFRAESGESEQGMQTNAAADSNPT